MTSYSKAFRSIRKQRWSPWPFISDPKAQALNIPFHVFYLRPISTTKAVNGTHQHIIIPFVRITNRLRTVSWSDKNHPTGVVNLWFKGRAISLHVMTVQRKGQQFVNQPPYRDKVPTAILGGVVIKMYHTHRDVAVEGLSTRSLVFSMISLKTI